MGRILGPDGRPLPTPKPAPPTPHERMAEEARHLASEFSTRQDDDSQRSVAVQGRATPTWVKGCFGVLLLLLALTFVGGYLARQDNERPLRRTRRRTSREPSQPTRRESRRQRCLRSTHDRSVRIVYSLLSARWVHRLVCRSRTGHGRRVPGGDTLPDPTPKDHRLSGSRDRRRRRGSPFLLGHALHGELLNGFMAPSPHSARQRGTRRSESGRPRRTAGGTPPHPRPQT